MNAKTLVAVSFTLVVIAIDDSNQFKITNNQLGECENLEMKYIGCMDRCMVNTRKKCDCSDVQNSYNDCWEARERLKAENPNWFSNSYSRVLRIPPKS